MLGQGPVHQWLQASVHIPPRIQRGSWGGDGILWGLEGLMEVEAAEASSRCSSSDRTDLTDRTFLNIFTVFLKSLRGGGEMTEERWGLK